MAAEVVAQGVRDAEYAKSRHGPRMNESQLLAELERLTLAVQPDRKDGYRTTTEMARSLQVKENIGLESAKKRVREMLLAAQQLGRLERGRVRVVSLDGHRTVLGYKLKGAAKSRKD